MLEIFIDGPNGRRTAVVCQDEWAAQVCLADTATSSPIAMCWVRNLMPAARWEERPPEQNAMMPPEWCNHPEGAPPLVEEDLEIVFFEDGSGFGLFERGDLLAVIPGWAKNAIDLVKGKLPPANVLGGYSRDCLERNPMAWPLEPARETLATQLEKARVFWREWLGDAGMERFFEWRDERIAAYKATLGAHRDYCVLDPDNWPACIALSFPTSQATICLTLGMAIQPMPGVGGEFDDPSPYHRIELGAVLPAGASPEQVYEVGKQLAYLVRFPWVNNAYFGHGHTIDRHFIPELPGMSHLNFLLLMRGFDQVLKLDRWSFRGDPVKNLWLVPITKRERELAINKGSEALMEQLHTLGVTVIWKPRSCTVKKKFFGWF